MSVQTPDVSDVAGYAAAVRRALAGLGPEQVEDLTDGLEADLAEAMADESTAGRGADPVSRFGTPEEYAAELGAAAGLEAVPVPVGRRRRGLPGDVRHPVRALRRFGTQLLERLRGHAWWPPFERFLVALRPVWWVARGWVVYQLGLQVTGAYPHQLLPGSVMRFVWLLVLVVASVQWGRGQWQLPRRWRAAPMLVSTVAAVALLPVLATVDEISMQYVYQEVPYPAAETPSNGVWVDGMQVSNLFVYDADGNPLRGVQIYDDRGRPVVATDDEGQDQWALPGVTVPWSFVGVPDSDGRVHWNVYPRQGAPSDQFQRDDQTGLQSLPDGAAPQDPPLPFAKAPALGVASAVPTAPAVPDDGATPGATDGAVPAGTVPTGAGSAAPTDDAGAPPTSPAPAP